MKYLIYCRRSSEDTKQSQSLEIQLNILNDFVTYNNLEVIDKIIESKSAKVDGQRLGFEELLERVKTGEADGILVAHIDRLSRNGTDSAKLTKLLTTGLLKEIRTRLSNEKIELEQAIKATNPKSTQTTLKLVKNWKNTVFDLETLFVEGDSLVKSDVLKSVLWNLEVKNKKVSNHRYKLPYAYLEKLPKNAKMGDWLSIWDEIANF